MSYLDKLKQSRNKSQVAYQEFALHTRQDKDGLFCFFEGKDNAYYVPRIKRFIKNNHPIHCGGREKVLEVYRLITIHREYDKYKKAFFIDRDFNQPLPPHNPPIFETSCYSIENFYVSVNVFKEIIKNEFHLSEVSEKLSFAFNNDHSSPSPILSNEQALKIFSDHAETPESLNIYLMQVI
jgi:hypothetical protein